MFRVFLTIAVALTLAFMVGATVVQAEILFSDNFEGDTLNAFPVADVGTWGKAGTGAGVVVNLASPGPAGGSQYLKITGGAWTNFMGPSLGGYQASGSIVRYEADTYLPTTASLSLYGIDYTTGVFGGAENDLMNARTASTTSTALYGTNTTPAGTIIRNQWQHWQWEYTIGATTWSLKIDDAPTVTGLPLYAGSNKTLNYMPLYVAATTVYFDNVKISLVPEPSSIALLASGVVGLLAYAWRKRK